MLPLVWLEADDSMEKPLLDFVQHETAQKNLVKADCCVFAIHSITMDVG